MIKTLAVHIIAYRKTILFLSLLLILSSTAGFKNLYFESSTDIWFLEDDPVLVEYNHLKDRFENNEFIVVGLKASPHDQNVLNKATMQAIEKMTDFLEAHPAVTKVTSLSKYQYIHGEDDYLAVDDIVPEDSEDFELSQQEWSAMLAILQKEILALDILFTKDLKHTVITARVIEQEDYTGEDNAKIQLVNDFKDFLVKNDLNNQTFKLFLSGSAAISESYFASSIADQSLIYPLMTVFILVFLFALFRTWTQAQATANHFGPKSETPTSHRHPIQQKKSTPKNNPLIRILPNPINITSNLLRPITLNINITRTILSPQKSPPKTRLTQICPTH
jgi:hypothetical protein